MSEHGSSAKAILYAFLANLFIAITKSGAAMYTHSGSMMAEAAFTPSPIAATRSCCTSALKQAQRPPDPLHPLGHGRLTYFWSFIVALAPVQRGRTVLHLRGMAQAACAQKRCTRCWVALVVLGVSIVLETGSLVRLLARDRQLRRGRSLAVGCARRCNAELVVALGEDIACAGVVCYRVCVRVNCGTDRRHPLRCCGSIAVRRRC